jgi:hypothetical protein
MQVKGTERKKHKRHKKLARFLMRSSIPAALALAFVVLAGPPGAFATVLVGQFPGADRYRCADSVEKTANDARSVRVIRGSELQAR